MLTNEPYSKVLPITLCEI